MITEQQIKKMSDGVNIVINKWIPDGDIKGIVILSHGMVEYSMRYDYFAQILNKNGIAFIAEDHRGHGETGELNSKEGSGCLGYLADKDGFFRVAKDIKEEIEEIKKNFPGKKVILLGHSFGSFVSQWVCEQYGNLIDGCILSGTAGPRLALVNFGRCLASIIKSFKGGKYVSTLLSKASFSGNNSKIDNPKTEYDWLSRDAENVKKYIEHKWCGFPCCTSFYKDMFTGLCTIHTKKNLALIPKKLPILLISGTGDPVGSYGKTVNKLYQIYKKNGMESVEIKFYKDGRHELLNEINHEEVENDLLIWINRLLDQQAM